MHGSLLFGVKGGGVYAANYQNVFTAQVGPEVHIGSGDFSSTPQIVLTARNFEHTTQNSCSPYTYIAKASATLYLYAYPAGAIQGTVSGAGTANVPLPGVVMSLTQKSDGITFKEYNSNLPNGPGKYAFAGRLGATYNPVSATYTTLFGETVTATYYDPAKNSYDVVAPSSPNPPYPTPAYTTADFHLPVSLISGTVVDNGNGAPISGASVQVVNPSGYGISTTTDANGNYHVWTAATGTYKLTASKLGYYTSPTYSDSVPSTGSYAQNFRLVKVNTGCVLAGTNITTPHGQKRVEQLSEGDAVLGYNVSSGSWVKESVTSNRATQVSQVLSINDGLLVTTLTKQPLYVKDGNWTGWVLDPQNLTVGEQLYDPLNGSWIAISSLHVLNGTFKVYDLQATSPNDFVANGILVDRKI